MRTLITALLAAAALTAAAQPAADRYVIRLDPAAAADRVDILAAQLAATHGGTVLSTDSATEDTVVLQLSPSRVRALAADPRVQSVDALKVAAQAVVEPVDWTTGVDYTYDGAGSVTRIGLDRFTYDAVGRLVQAKVNGVTRDYSYDAFGNRTGCSAPGTDCQYAYDISSNNNRISEPGTEHDAAGNVEKLGKHEYTYDAGNMMTRDHSPAGRYEYLYTADDERIATFEAGSGTWNWALRDQEGKVLREFTSNGSTWEWKRDYVYREGLLVASRVPLATTVANHHYHLDHLGTPRRVTGDDDLIIGYHDYYAFGPEVSGSLQEPNATDLKYTGHEREPFTDEFTLDYMHARFYTPTLGRFLSSDPVLDVGRATAEPQAWNRYAYVVNNPMSRIDPDGRLDGNSDDMARQLFPNDRRAQLAFDQDVAEGTFMLSATFASLFLPGPEDLVMGGWALNAGIKFVGRVLGKFNGVMKPSTIRFTQNSIKSAFKDGSGSVDDLIKGLKNGSIEVTDVPAIRVYLKDGKWYTLDNRRLYAFQQAGVKNIPVKRVNAADVEKEIAKKFTTKNDGTSVRVRQ